MRNPLPQMNTDAGWDTSEIARRLGVTTVTVRNWRLRYADFPNPIGVREHGHWYVWEPDQVIKWFENRKFRLSLKARRSTFGRARSS